MNKIVKFYIACFVLIPIVYILFPYLLIKINTSLNFPVLDFVGQEIIGGIILIAGLLLFPYCSSIFFRYGKRTPLFTESEGKFFKNGIYKYSRNPMYVGHVMVLLGIFVWNGSLTLLIYSLLGWIVLQSYIVFIEEPELKKRYGEKYEEYLKSVPRWMKIY